MFPQVNPGSDACQVARGRLDFLFFIFLFFYFFYFFLGFRKGREYLRQDDYIIAVAYAFFSGCFCVFLVSG